MYSEHESKIGYVRGLFDGLELDPASKEHKLFSAVIDALESLGETISELEEATDDIEDTVDSLQESVDEIEDNIEEYDEFFEVLGNAAEEKGALSQFPNLKSLYSDDDGDDGGDNEIEYWATCPKCNEEFMLTEEEFLSGSTVCANRDCKEKIDLAPGDHHCGGCCQKDSNGEDEED
ncbi:MAG: hypothetical protein FWH04_05450 [Oscillospiraceae bacterium]|nr:hypothetical protein [Oscillospiraceae bacterium]